MSGEVAHGAQVPASNSTGTPLKAQASLWPTPAKLWTLSPTGPEEGVPPFHGEGIEAREAESCSLSGETLSHPSALSVFLSLLRIFFLNLATHP